MLNEPGNRMSDAVAAKHDEIVKGLISLRCANKSCEQHRKEVTDEQVAWMFNISATDDVLKLNVLYPCCPEFGEVLTAQFKKLKK